MGNGIVDVQQIEIVDFRHLGHARGQRQVIRRIVKQRIMRDLYLVIENVGLRSLQPERLRIGDEMNFVSALRQLNSQFRCNHTAATVGGITGNTDFHPGSRFRFQPARSCDPPSRRFYEDLGSRVQIRS